MIAFRVISGIAQCVTAEPISPGLAQWAQILIIVLAVVFVFAAIFAAVFIVLRCRKRRQIKKHSAHSTKSTMPIISEIRQSVRSEGHDNLPDMDILASERPRSVFAHVPSPHVLIHNSHIHDHAQNLFNKQTIILVGIDKLK